MSADRLSMKYRNGVEFFLEFCARNTQSPNSIPCPCVKCGNVVRMPIFKIKDQLFRNGIDKSYKVWFLHGERMKVTDEGPSKNNKYFDVDYEVDDIVEMIDDAQYESHVEPIKFQSILEDDEKPIFPNCTRFTKLSTLLKLYNLKAKHGWSDKGMTELLTFLGELLPEGNEMPS